MSNKTVLLIFTKLSTCACYVYHSAFNHSLPFENDPCISRSVTEDAWGSVRLGVCERDREK